MIRLTCKIFCSLKKFKVTDDIIRVERMFNRMTERPTFCSVILVVKKKLETFIVCKTF